MGLHYIVVLLSGILCACTAFSRGQILRNERSLANYQHVDQQERLHAGASSLMKSRLLRGKDSEKKKSKGKGKGKKVQKHGTIPSNGPSLGPSTLNSIENPSSSPVYGSDDMSKTPSQRPMLTKSKGTRAPSLSPVDISTSIPSVHPFWVPLEQPSTSPSFSTNKKTYVPSLVPSLDLSMTISPSSFGTKFAHIPSMSPSEFQTERPTHWTGSARPTRSPSTLVPSSTLIVSLSPSMVVNSYSYSYQSQNPTRQPYSYSYGSSKPSMNKSYSYSYFYHRPQPSLAQPQKVPTRVPSKKNTNESGHPQIVPSFIPVVEYVPSVPIAVTTNTPSSLQQEGQLDIAPTIIKSAHPAKSSAPVELDASMIPSSFPIDDRMPFDAMSLAEENEVRLHSE